MEEWEQDKLYCSEECAQAERTEEPKTQTKTEQKPKSKPKPARTRGHMALTINDVVRWTVQQYNQKGAIISYGKAVVILEAEQNIESTALLQV